MNENIIYIGSIKLNNVTKLNIYWDNFYIVKNIKYDTNYRLLNTLLLLLCKLGFGVFIFSYRSSNKRCSGLGKSAR